MPATPCAVCTSSCQCIFPVSFPAGGWSALCGMQRVKAEQQEHRQRMLEGALAHNEQRRDMGECAICMQRTCNSAFPCGHVIACYACALQCDRCPMCRRRGQPIRLYPAAPAAGVD